MFIKNKSVLHIFLVAIALGILIPLINIYFVFPAFKNLLIKNTEDDSVRTATHLTSMFKQGYAELTKDSIPPDLIKKIEMFQNDLQFANLNLFSKDGEVIYSTDPKDIGKIDNNPYFYEIIAKGNPYSKTVKKDTTSPEGKRVTINVVETFIPIKDKNTFIGAIKIGYNITQRNLALNIIVIKAGAIPLVMMLGGFTLTVLILIHLDKSITRQKKTEEELKVFAEKLQQSNRELESFANIASHDLQEPLRKVMTFGDRMVAKYSGSIDEEGLDYLKRMQNAARRMQTLINSLLTFSRVTTKGQPFESVNLDRVAREVITDLEVRLEQTKGKVEISNLATIDADPLQIRQLLQNLISNALKFAQKDTPPVVKISGKVIGDYGGHTYRIGNSSEVYQLTVEDNGIGFDEKYADRIFGVFQRLHARSEYEGTGIGLSVCRRIAERHNGNITAKGSPGKGAAFFITLPINQ